jgi:RNA polymerase sigma-70 factor (ECF subfamily)
MKSPNQKPPDEELVARIQEGDRGAFETLFRFYYEEVCGFVDSKIGASNHSDDIVQEIFLGLWRRRADLTIRSTFRAYLFGAARKEAISHRERREVRNQSEEDRKEMWDRVRNWSSPSPVEHLEYNQLERELQTFIAELPERRREVYVLSRQHGLTYEEIATVMDISPKTVDNQMVEALKFLRKRLRSRSEKVPS